MGLRLVWQIYPLPKSLGIKFLYVGADVCLRFPSDSISQWTPLLSAVAFPLLGRLGDSHPLEHVRAGRTKKRGNCHAAVTSKNVM